MAENENENENAEQTNNGRHFNIVYYATQRAIYRMMPDLKSTAEGRQKVEDIIVEVMREVREMGITYRDASGN